MPGYVPELDGLAFEAVGYMEMVHPGHVTRACDHIRRSNNIYA